MFDLTSLERKIEVFRAEVHLLISLQESWRPTAFDEALRDRLGTSRATHTFNTTRAALRREVIRV